MNGHRHVDEAGYRRHRDSAACWQDMRRPFPKEPTRMPQVHRSPMLIPAVITASMMVTNLAGTPASAARPH